MEKLATYKFYIETYGGEMEEGAFDKVIVKASAFINYITAGRAGDTDDVKLATCAVADVYNISKDIQQTGGIIASETNDGYSVSYATNTDMNTEEAINARAAAAARIYLKVSRRVGVLKC